jgi:hypothetical protein
MEKKGTGDGKYGDYTEFLALWTEEDLNDSWLKKEGENNMKTAKRAGQEQGMPSFTSVTFHCDKHVVLRIITSSSKEHISSIILQMDAACSTTCCYPSPRLHFDPTIGTGYFLKIFVST